MAQTIKLKRSSVSGNTPSTSDLELGEVAINTYDGKMFIKKNDGSDSIVEIGGTSGTVTEAFKTIAVSGQSNVVADSATDTLTLVAGSNMTITTNASGDTVTFASSGGGGTQNVFNTFAVSGQSSVVADSTTDTLTLAAGSGINITTNASTDTITIAATASAITVQDEGSALSTSATTLNFVGAGVTASGTGATKTITIGGGGGSQNLFSNIGVSGQGTIQADSTTDTLTFEAGTGISLATDTTNDKLTITATGGTASVANAASSIKEFKYDISSSTTTITGSDANSNTLAYEAGAIQVFLNGILLDPATDYTASNGTSVVLTDAAVSGDDVQIVAFNRKIVTANVGLSTFTGDGTTTAFTLSSDPVNENNTRVHIDGVYQEKAAYSVSGTTLTFSGAPPNGSSIEVEIGFTQAEIGSTLDFADNAILRIGTGNDLQILHDGSDSIIKDTGTGDLQIAASTLDVKNSGLSETMLKAIEDGAVELYFDNSKKLETVTGGVTITGTVTATTFSGDLSGTINTATTGTTQSASDNSTKLATTAYVTTALANLVDSAPGTLNTLNELAAALGDDANFSTTITNSLNLKVGRDSATGAASIPAGTTAQRPGSPAAGQFRYNSTLNQFEGYTSSWGAIGGGGTNTFTTDVFTSSGSAAFTLTQAVASPNDCIVHIDGIYQTPTDAYTVSGTTLTFTATPASGRKVVVYSIKAGVSGNNVEVQTINGNGSDHTFTLNVNPVNENNTIVHIDGVYQQKSSYTVSGTSLSFGSGNIPANGTVIEVATFTQTEINVPVNDTIDTVHIKDDAVTSAKLGGNLVTPGTLDVNGAEFILDADADTSLTADTDDQIDIKIGGTDQIKLIDGAILPVTTNDIDLGSTSLEFKNAYFDGTVTSDAFAGPLTGNVTGNVSGTAATVTGAAQTNITSVGTLTGLNLSGNVFSGNKTGLTDTNTGHAIAPGGLVYHATDGTIVQSLNRLTDDGPVLRLVGNTTTAGSIGVLSGGLSFGSGSSMTTRMVIDSSGKVGIGTDNPNGDLHLLHGSTNAFTASNDSWHTIVVHNNAAAATNTTGIAFEVSGSGYHANAGTGIAAVKNGTNSDYGADLVFVTRPQSAVAVERMRIDSTGNVGIGASSPDSLLELETAVTNATGGLLLTNTNASGYSTVQFKNTGGTAQTYTMALGGSSSAFAQKLYIYDDTDSAARVVLDHSGNVGIATSNLTEKLEVNGSINTTYQSTNFTAGAQRGFLDMVDASKHVRIGSLTGAATATGTQGTVEVVVNNSAKVIVDTSGNVGIGVTPSAHHYKTLEIGIVGNAITGRSSADMHFLSGLYWDGASTHKYAVSGVGVGKYQITNGIHYWSSVASGTAGNAATVSANMTLDASGNLGIGITSGMDRNLHIKGSNSDVGIQIEKTGSHELRVAIDSTGPYLYAEGTAPLRFYQNNAEIVRITGGKVGINANNPSKLLHVTGNDNQVVIDGNGSSANSGLFFAEQGTDKWEVYHRGADDTFRIYNYGTSSPNLLITSAGRLQLDKYSIKFDGTTQGKHEIRTGGRTGTGTYTLFTNGSSVTQSGGIVEVWGIYSTPSNCGYRMYVIGGNRTIATAVAYTQTGSVPQPTLAWSGANLQISNSNSSLYYHVRVTLHDIGNSWAATWGNFPGIG